MFARESIYLWDTAFPGPVSCHFQTVTFWQRSRSDVAELFIEVGVKGGCRSDQQSSSVTRDEVFHFREKCTTMRSTEIHRQPLPTGRYLEWQMIILSPICVDLRGAEIGGIFLGRSWRANAQNGVVPKGCWALKVGFLGFTLQLNIHYKPL